MALPPLYSASEYQLVRQMNAYKYAFFQPVAKALISAGFTASSVTLLSMAVIASAFIFAVQYTQPSYFISGIILHCILDGLDGTIARLTRSESLSGAALDLVADHGGIVLSAWFAAYFLGVPEVTAILYVMLYTIVNPVSFMLGVSEHRVSYIFRPRLLIYLALMLDILLTTQLTNPVMFIGVLVLFAESFIVLRAVLRRHLS